MKDLLMLAVLGTGTWFITYSVKATVIVCAIYVIYKFINGFFKG